MTQAFERADQYFRAGRLEEAESLVRAILTDHPDNLDALNLLGVIAAQKGQVESAAEFFQRAMAVILSNFSESLRMHHRISEALPLLSNAVALAPSFAKGHIQLAETLTELGQTEKALDACRVGLMNCPNEHKLNGLAGDLLLYRKPLEAASYLCAALEQAPDFADHWERLGILLTSVSLPLTKETRPWLQKALTYPGIYPSDIASSIARTLCRDQIVADLANRAEQGDFPRGEKLAETFVKLSSDTLLLTLMESAVIPNVLLERIFTGLRRMLLLHIESYAFPTSILPFCAALSMQAFISEYAWHVTEEEEDAVERVSVRLKGLISDQSRLNLSPPFVAVLGAYRPLHGLEYAEQLQKLSWPTSLTNLIRTQISEPIEERALRHAIPRITSITDPISKTVRAQYEENPYPRWVRADLSSAKIPLLEFIKHIGGTIPNDSSFTAPNVLIAGCGTGQQSVFAASFYQDAKILAIDLSLSSLAYAARKSRELGLTNIDYRHGDIMEMAGNERRFHIIECKGVLHHLADPIAGWRILVDLLQSGGLMRIALYSEIGRRKVVMAREYIVEMRYDATVSDIRRCRHDIINLPDSHPLSSLKHWRDLYSISECRDLLFHVQEHRFTLPEIKDALEILGLRFLRFNIPNTTNYQQQFPQDPSMTSFDNWHEIEQKYPDTFANTYDFWVQKI